MNLNQLKIFYFAVKAKNLSAAADQLFITQPAVTKGIQLVRVCHSNGLLVRVTWLTPTKSASVGRTDLSDKCTWA